MPMMIFCFRLSPWPGTLFPCRFSASLPATLSQQMSASISCLLSVASEMQGSRSGLSSSYLRKRRTSLMVQSWEWASAASSSSGETSPCISNCWRSRWRAVCSAMAYLLLWCFLTARYFCIDDVIIHNKPVRSEDNTIAKTVQRIVNNMGEGKNRIYCLQWSASLLFLPIVYNLNLMSEFKYRINSVTSERPRYPAANLTVGQQGWQSAINCVYPQAITIQFFLPIRTKRLQLLFHQYKIPRLVDVFVKLGSRAKYRKLGFLTPNDNAQSSFEEREEKTLYFEFACTHVRLVLHENFKNDRNVFNQVALEDLTVFGELLTHKEMEGVDLTEQDSSEDEASESIDLAHNARTLEQVLESPVMAASGQTSALFRPIYEKLQIEKVTAVEREDFQMAAHFKKILGNFKQLEGEMDRLEREKQEALGRQDYDRCHRIKFQLAKKREVVEFQREELFKNEDQFYSQNSFVAVEREPETKREPVSPKNIAQFRSPEVEKKPVIANASNRYDQQVVPALLNKVPRSSESLPLETNEKRRDFSAQINQSVIAEVQAEVDSGSIKKDLNELRELSDPAQVSMSSDAKIELVPLETKLRLRVETYFGFIPERVWQLAESRNWRGKQEALRFVRERVGAVQSKEQFMGTFQLLSRVVSSKQAALSLEVIHLINKLADLKIRFTLQHMPFFVEEILTELLNFLNDTNRQVKELAYSTYLKLPDISFLGLPSVARELLRHKIKVKNDPKLIITKLQLMGALLERHSQQDFPHRETVAWILTYIDDPNQKVRSEAAELLVTLTYLIGNEKVLKLIEATRPQMMESVLNMMNASVDYSKIHNEPSKLSLDNSKLHQEFYGPEQARPLPRPPNNPSNVHSTIPLENPSEKPIFLLQSQEKQPRMEQSGRSRNENANVDLSYSKQSIFQQSANPSKLQSDDEGIRVYDDYPYQQSGRCSYCSEEYSDQREHYINDCRVLVYCEQCNGYIYIREFTHHLLAECEHSHRFTQCRKCGVALELEESNEHVGRDACRNKKGVNWERCQFCSEDIFAEDKFWIKHAQECRHLPTRPHYSTEEEEENQ